MLNLRMIPELLLPVRRHTRFPQRHTRGMGRRDYIIYRDGFQQNRRRRREGLQAPAARRQG